MPIHAVSVYNLCWYGNVATPSVHTIAIPRAHAMDPKTLYQYIKLGMNVEYLRGVCSVSIMPAKTLAKFPRLVENLPPNRFPVTRVVETMRAIMIQLEDLGFEQSRAEAEQLQPLLSQMETYLGETPDPKSAFMNDSFADKLVFFINELLLALKKEASNKMAAQLEEDDASGASEGQ